MSKDFLEWAWATRCGNLGEKLVLVAIADGADLAGRVRIDPVVLAPRVGISPSRVDAALATLTRSGLIESRRWDDTGAWSVRVIGWREG